MKKLITSLLTICLLNSCVIGNFGLTRKIAKWNLSFSLIPRVIVAVILQVLPVYGLSMLFDLVLNNTLEFWTKSKIISASLPQVFEKDGYEITVNHALRPLKYTNIQIKNQKSLKIEQVEIIEQSLNNINIIRNSNQIANIDYKTNLVLVSYFHKDGEIKKKEIFDLNDQKIISKLANILPSEFNLFAQY